MSRTSFHYRIDTQNGRHVFVTVFAGPDEQHRACAGQLVFRRREWEDFRDRVEGPGHMISERAAA